MRNRQVQLARRPTGIPQADDFALVETPVPEPGPGEVLVRVAMVSVEPAMRGWLADRANYSEPVEIGGVMRSLGLGEVIASNAPEVPVGVHVVGWFGWQTYAAVPPEALVRIVTETDLPLSLGLGVLGINGVTAYLALQDIGSPGEGQTVLVSTAAGAVGSVVGQLARLWGARAVGLAGGPAKVELCRSFFRFDQAVDYKSPDWEQALQIACPEGVDVFFDNTGGALSDAVYAYLNVGARVVVCGTAATAQWDPWPVGARLERHILTKRLKVQGFVVFDHMARWDAAVGALADWVRNGQLVYKEDILEGLEACPDAIAGLYRGENLGKRLVRL